MERGVADTVVERRVGVTVAMGDLQGMACPAGMLPAQRMRASLALPVYSFENSFQALHV